VANNDLSGVSLQALTLNRASSAAASITGGALEFSADSLGAARITQDGGGAFTMSNNLVLAAPLVVGGAGTGVTSLSGVISGSDSLEVAAGHWVLSNTANTWTGGTTITGGVLELSPGPDAALDIPDETDSPLGYSGPVTINGGELRLTTSGTGRIQTPIFTARLITFGTSGGVLRFNGQIQDEESSTFTVALPASPATLSQTAVLQFAGGEQGTSNGGTDWAASGNALRIAKWSNLDAKNPVRIELTHGALLVMGTAYQASASLTFDSPLTLRGVIGGDPTATTASTEVGRVLLDRAVSPNTFNFVNGLAIEGVMQISNGRGPRPILGNITVRDGGVAVFAGRGTGSAITTSNGSRLELGLTSNVKTITVQSGGTMVTDLRIRYESPNEFGVRVNDAIVVQAGGILRTTQSWMGSAPGGADKSVGWHEFLGDLTAEGSSAAEAVFDLRLGAANLAGPFTNENGVSFGTHASGGVLDPTALDITINGSGYGGLRVQTAGRVTKSTAAPTGTPVYLFGEDGSGDPITNDAKLDNFLTANRLAALRGSGGYLTPAAQGAVFTFPIGGEWASAIGVGLKVIDSNAAGTDLAFGTGMTSWGHNLAVEKSATIDLGPEAFTLLAGALSGKGRIAGDGGLTIAAGARLAPGLDGADVTGTLGTGALTLLKGSHFSFDLATPSTSDQVLTGALDLRGQDFSDFDFNPLAGFGAGTYTLFASSGLTGSLGVNVTGFVGGYESTLSISGHDLTLVVVPEPGTMVAFLSAAALLLGRRRPRAPLLLRAHLDF
jgi:autotransporter-associated beta strand protein